MKERINTLTKLLVLILIQFLIAGLVACDQEESDKSMSRVDQLRELLIDEKRDHVMVIAHRGDWRNAPENSLRAISNSIAMGVDMVEIDVRLTKDSIPVLMHDATIDRTTSGKGAVSGWTLDSLKTLFLRNGANHITHHRIPTLEEAMLEAKGKILINLDKCYDHFDKVFPVLEKTGTLDHVVMKGSVPLAQLQKEFSQYLDKVIYMPVLRLNAASAGQMLMEYQQEFRAEAYEFIFPDESSQVLDQFDEIRKSGARIWVNSLWSSLNAGYEDDQALMAPDSIYGWYIEKKVSMIQTDRPAFLLEFLRKRGLHD